MAISALQPTSDTRVLTCQAPSQLMLRPPPEPRCCMLLEGRPLPPPPKRPVPLPLVRHLPVVLHAGRVGAEDEPVEPVVVGVEDDLEAVGLGEVGVPPAVGGDDRRRVRRVADDAEVRACRRCGRCAPRFARTPAALRTAGSARIRSPGRRRRRWGRRARRRRSRGLRRRAPAAPAVRRRPSSRGRRVRRSWAAAPRTARRAPPRPDRAGTGPAGTGPAGTEPGRGAMVVRACVGI